MVTPSQSDSVGAPPAPFLQISSDKLQLKEGGGCLALFGLPFFAAGVLMALTLMGIGPMKVEPNNKWTPWALGAMSVVFTTAGAVMMFGRQWLIIDVTRRCVIRQYGLLVPFRTCERSLSEFNALVIVHDPGDSDSPERFPVRLRSTRAPDFVISRPGQFGEALAQAEYLARLLRFPLVDTTSDHETVMDSGKGVLTLQERAVTTPETVTPERPAKMRALVSEATDRTTVVIPGGGSWFAGLLGLVFPVFVLFIVVPGLMRFFTRTHTPHYVQFGFLLFLTLIFVVPTIFASVNLMVGSRRKRLTVTATPEGLTIEQRTAWRTRSKFVSGADLLDIDCSTVDGTLASAKASLKSSNSPSYGRVERVFEMLKKYIPSKGITVKSRRELLTFGEGLPAGELRFLVWTLRRALGGHRDRLVTKVSGAFHGDGV